MLRGDVLAEHSEDSLLLHLVTVDLHRLQVTHPLCLLLPVALHGKVTVSQSLESFAVDWV